MDGVVLVDGGAERSCDETNRRIGGYTDRDRLASSAAFS
jgi:hypothetical protein